MQTVGQNSVRYSGELRRTPNSMTVARLNAQTSKHMLAASAQESLEKKRNGDFEVSHTPLNTTATNHWMQHRNL